jgi:hypothetical protein
LDFSVYFAHLFLVSAKNVAVALPALPLLNETVTAHSYSSAWFILFFARLLHHLVLWSVDQFLVLLCLDRRKQRTSA